MKKNGWMLAFIIWMAAIFFFTQLPYFTGENTMEILRRILRVEAPGYQQGYFTFEIEYINMIIRKFAHLLVFGTFAILLYMCARKLKSAFIISWIGTVIYAAMDEWHQSFVPGRAPLATDVIIDSAGALIALILTFLFIQKTKKRIKADQFKDKRM